MNTAPAISQHDDTHDLIEAARHASEAERALLEDEVVRRHLGLAHHLAGRYSGRGADRDDLAQVACFALVKAIRGFDHERGEFVPFATVTILGEIKKYFRDYCWGIRPPRRIQQMQADISSATERCLQSDSRQPDIATIAGETSDYDFIDDWVTIEPLCRDLDDEERLLLRLRFVEDKTQQEIAEIVGVSQMQISRRLAKLLARLRASALAVDAA